MSIYLAGPEVFLPDPTSIGEDLKKICTTHGATGLFPMDKQIPDHILNPQTTSKDTPKTTVASWIRTANLEMIRRADAVVANMTPFRGPSMDVGTAYEIGYAAALGKVVVGYSEDRRTYLEKCVGDGHVKERGDDGHYRDGSGWAVEEFEGEGMVDNLMIAHGLDGEVCVSVEEAVKLAVQILKDRGVVKP